ncbi:ATP synthase subunit b [Desulfosarcina cetonica]|uniref:F0F1 ATP synthase subunit B family protein n=1 Tax=Desulfosarcina cetonica TaxID=90730 RepID=UPI0006D223C4|nr:hypothetical protein [Desulfosarcina cetonica]VTR69216.1 ATP synthase subunit b [Desulfosarcina cetonica]
MEIISATALISINETFFIQLISFLIFLYVMNRIMIQPLISMRDERNTYFETISTDIETAKSNLDTLNRDLDAQRKKLLKEANEVVSKLEEEADQDASTIVASARTDITDLRNATEAKVNEQLKTARSQLQGEVESLTTLVMEKVLHRRLQ